MRGLVFLVLVFLMDSCPGVEPKDYEVTYKVYLPGHTLTEKFDCFCYDIEVDSTTFDGQYVVRYRTGEYYGTRLQYVDMSFARIEIVGVRLRE